MKQKIFLLFYSMGLTALIFFTSCNNGSGCTLTHEDSVKIAHAVMNDTMQISSGSDSVYGDTILLPRDFTKASKLVNGNGYTYIGSLNALVKTDISKERGLMLSEKATAPVDTATLNQYVKNYKIWVNGNAGTYTKQYCYLIQKSNIEDLFNVTPDCMGIRVYMGIADSTNPAVQTVVLTGYNQFGGDIYLPGPTPNSARGIDQASPCPTDCPYKWSDGMDAQDRPKTNKMMLGRIKAKDPQ